MLKESISTATLIRNQAYEIKFHHGKPSLPSELKKLRELVDKLENLIKEGK